MTLSIGDGANDVADDSGGEHRLRAIRTGGFAGCDVRRLRVWPVQVPHEAAPCARSMVVSAHCGHAQ